MPTNKNKPVNMEPWTPPTPPINYAARELALVLINEVRRALKNGVKHYRKSNGELLETDVEILKALRDEKEIIIEPVKLGRRITIPEDAEVTWVEDDICVCNNCGAFAASPQKIEHHKTCQAGEAKKWAEFYAKESDIENEN